MIFQNGLMCLRKGKEGRKALSNTNFFLVYAVLILRCNSSACPHRRQRGDAIPRNPLSVICDTTLYSQSRFLFFFLSFFLFDLVFSFAYLPSGEWEHVAGGTIFPLSLSRHAAGPTHINTCIKLATTWTEKKKMRVLGYPHTFTRCEHFFLLFSYFSFTRKWTRIFNSWLHTLPCRPRFLRVKHIFSFFSCSRLTDISRD